LGAADYHGHVLVALQHSGGPTLARVARAASDGDLAVSSELQVALALDLAHGLAGCTEAAWRTAPFGRRR